jgi:glutathionylspermidine synthase
MDIEINAPDYDVFVRDEDDDHFINVPESEFVYQDFVAPPVYSGIINRTNLPMLGIWMVNGEAVGMGIRESDRPITDYECRFAPHLVQVKPNLIP